MFKPYKKSDEYSYALGAFPAYELIKNRHDAAETVFCHSSYTGKEELFSICREYGVSVELDDRQIERLSDKENIYVVGVFRKYSCCLDPAASHLSLVQPSNMGNIGTIIRTSIGFGVKNLAIIGQGADIFNPKVIRASMGAIFRINFQYFDTFEEYTEKNPGHEVYTFMLDKDNTVMLQDCQRKEPFTLVFGNEATGLPPEYLKVGTSVMIPQTDEVDSLNLTIAAGIGLYHFTTGYPKLS